MVKNTARFHALLAASTMSFGAAKADPPPVGAWEPIPELTDEFSGAELDAAKWHDKFVNPEWKGREPALFMPSNVAVRDGQLHLTARVEEVPDAPTGYHTFTTAAVKSKAKVLYGYFEIRCRPMRSRASSAFWLYENEPTVSTEIDIFEIAGAAPGEERNYHLTAHVHHAPEVKAHFGLGDVW
jgi:beta-glucanase (GH16 family)